MPSIKGMTAAPERTAEVHALRDGEALPQAAAARNGRTPVAPTEDRALPAPDATEETVPRADQASGGGTGPVLKGEISASIVRLLLHCPK
jgi:hypothetical protein